MNRHRSLQHVVCHAGVDDDEQTVNGLGSSTVTGLAQGRVDAAGTSHSRPRGANSFRHHPNGARRAHPRPTVLRPSRRHRAEVRWATDPVRWRAGASFKVNDDDLTVGRNQYQHHRVPS